MKKLVMAIVSFSFLQVVSAQEKDGWSPRQFTLPELLLTKPLQGFLSTNNFNYLI